MLISIIVPIYNSANTLSRCIDSLLNQGLYEYEIICVNDGSTDNSMSILEQYKEKYPSIIRIVSQPNSGLGSARNKGIEKAEGEIVAFCDSDDYLVPNGLYTLVQNFWEENVDVLVFQSVTMDRYNLKNFKEFKSIEGKVLFEGRGREIYKYPSLRAAWNRLYRKSFLNSNKLRFTTTAFAEDYVFNLDVYMKNPYVRETSLSLYRYTVSSTQMTSVREPEKMKRILSSYMFEFERNTAYMNECADNEAELKNAIYNNRYSSTNAFFSRMMSAKLSKREYTDTIHKMHNLGWLPLPYSSKAARFEAMLASSFIFYCISAFFYREIFVKHILPRMRRG